MNLEPFIHWVVERELIRVRKDVEHRDFPWTDDPILGKYRFCNVRREDDRVTRWIDANIRKPFATHEHLWFMLCAARVINWPDTLAELIARDGCWPSTQSFDPKFMGAALESRAERGDKVWTGAYMITAPPTKGAKKTTFVAEQTLGRLWRDRNRFVSVLKDPGVDPTLQRIHIMLMRYNGWGPFMAYQAVVDMRFTELLRDAPDVATWAAAGPGTLRGLNRLHGRAVDAALDQIRALRELRVLWPILKKETGVDMDFSDVPNICCEVDKYLRVKNGEGKPRALYVPGRGS